MSAHNTALVVDLSNVAATPDGSASLEHAASVISAAEVQLASAQTFVVADASLRHRLSPEDRAELDAAVRNGTVVQAPSGTSADPIMLQLATRRNSVIVSNDGFREWRHRFPDLFGRPDQFMGWVVIGGHVILEYRRLARLMAA